jgi:hypothetical protein
MMQLFADLQSLQDNDLVVASLDFLKGGTVVSDDEAHPLVLVEDGEGQACWGYIERWRGRLVDVRLDLSTWRSRDEVEIPTRVSGQQVAYIATSQESPSASHLPSFTPVFQLVS